MTSSFRTFQAEIWLPKPVEAVFGFFAEARNLQAITPDWLDFQILTPGPIVMRTGAIIDYRLRLRGFPLRWRTEITAWEPPFRFVDEQRQGPYKLWIHEHRFEPIDNGTRARDFVRYAPPGGWLTDWLFVRRDIERIFRYRQQKLTEQFRT
ncbi:MAG TPA: SRPBCC family protein [Verrucomicrobiae bacterium]|nr:SRPBCC family protein [Verrucomicrobiae bacterium]